MFKLDSLTDLELRLCYRAAEEMKQQAKARWATWKYVGADLEANAYLEADLGAYLKAYRKARRKNEVV